MNSNNSEDEVLSPRRPEETDSARKRMRLEMCARKSWSLTDKKTDQEVLMEMGVSVLEPDEIEVDLSTSGSLLKSGTKRKRNIENVNPNVNSGVSVGKGSPKRSPRKLYSPAAGPSALWSPAKPCQLTEQALESTLLQPYLLVDEETPVAQLGSEALGRLSPQFSSGCRTVTPSSQERHHAPLTPVGSDTTVEPTTPGGAARELRGADSFAALSDEVMLGIFKWMPKRTLAHCMLVCKRWNRVACDETFWQRLELGNRTLARGALAKILARKPIVVRLAGSEIGEWHPTSQPEPSRIQYLDLSMCSVDRTTLAAFLERCPALKKLSLEGVTVDQDICTLIGKCSKMETLNLTMAAGITENGLRSILEGCIGLQSLNISWCNLSAAALDLLGDLAPQRLQRLNVAGARIITDDMVTTLVTRCSRLVELDLSDCSRLGAAAALSVLKLNRLEHLALSRCYLLPPHVLTKLSCMPALQYLEVWGMLQDASLAALRSALPAIQLNQFMHSAIARPTVGNRRTSIWGLRTRD